MPLSRDEVLAAALRLLDDIGLEALTMRRLAQKLKVQAGALYWHFGNKQELIDAMADAQLAGLIDERLTGPWDRRLATICRRLAVALRARRDSARLATLALQPGPNALAVSELMLATASSAGFSKKETLWATAVLGYYVLGYVTDLQAMQRATANSISATLATLRKQLHSDKYPKLAALDALGLEEMVSVASFEERFEFGLDVILEGLKSWRRRRRR